LQLSIMDNHQVRRVLILTISHSSQRDWMSQPYRTGRHVESDLSIFIVLKK
jgi:hypothetical protein